MRRKRVRDEYEMPVMFPLTPPGAISFWSLHFPEFITGILPEQQYIRGRLPNLSGLGQELGRTRGTEVWK